MFLCTPHDRSLDIARMFELNTIDVLGGGPAGLYIAQLLKRDRPTARVRVLEQNPRGATFGFGVVFSQQALDFLKADDPDTHALITPHMERWQNMTLAHPDRDVVIDGVGFAAIGRLQLIELLTQRAEEVGVEILFEHPVHAADELQADLIVGADGLNSIVRQSREAAFKPRLSEFENYFAWFGTSKSFDTLTQTFLNTECGALNAHHYRYQENMSTFIVECEPMTYKAFGFDQMDESQSASQCEEFFASVLDGAPLITNKSQWRRFPKLWCEHWVAGNHVLIGDSAHTAHFSVGSGTRLAMEDGIALANALRDGKTIDTALAGFETSRQAIARKIVNAANTSANWYETFGERMSLPALDFGYDYITRSGRVDDARLRQLSPGFMNAYDNRGIRT